MVILGEVNNHPVKYEKITDPYDTEACNCVTYVRNRVNQLPRMVNINPNSDPSVGSVAVEWFGKVKHISLVTKVEDSGVWVEESNYVNCEIGTRFIKLDRYSLVGFWSSYGTI